MRGRARVELTTAVALLLAAPVVHAQGWETPAPLDAREQLGAKRVKGPHHEVLSKVESDGLNNRYIVVSKYQRVGADGNTLLEERVREQSAMAALRAIKTTDAYQKGLMSAAEAPIAVTKQMLQDPKGVVAAAPQAMSNFVSDVRGALGGLRQGASSDADMTDTMKQLIGYGKVKGRLAHDFGVDVHSSNEVLQTDLDDVAWAIFAGGASIDLAMTQAPMAAGLSRTAVEQLDAAVAPIWEVPPSTLVDASASAFEQAGLSSDEARKLASSDACTLTHQTRLAATLASLPGVAGRDAFARHAGGAKSEADCRRHVETARLLHAHHTRQAPIARIRVSNGVVTFADAKGHDVLPLRADYVYWTPASGSASTSAAACGVQYT